MVQRSHQEIQATIAHSSLPEGRQSATIEVFPHELIVRYGDERLTLPLREIVISRGGANGRVVFFSHPHSPNWQVFTTDTNVLRLIKNTAHIGSAKQLARAETKRPRGWLTLVIVVAVLLGVSYGAWELRNPTVKYIAKVVPPSWERKLGEVVYSAIKSDRSIIEDAELDKELAELLAPLTEHTKNTPYTFEFHISRDDDLNAFALPGGIVVLNKGTILRSPKLETLLGVLAHELSHVTLQHTTRQVITVFGLYIVVDFVFGNIFGTVAAISQGAGFLLQQGFSRESEAEADNAGFELLLRANINPLGMVEFFKLVQEDSEKYSPAVLTSLDKALNFLSTHPDTESRIAYLTQRIESQPATSYRELAHERFVRFQTRLRELSSK